MTEKLGRFRWELSAEMVWSRSYQHESCEVTTDMPVTWQLASNNGRERSHEVSTRASIYGPLREDSQRRILLWLSSLSSEGQQEEGWRPNHDAVTEVIQETWPDTRVPRLDYCQASDLLGLWVPWSEVWRELVGMSKFQTESALSS